MSIHAMKTTHGSLTEQVDALRLRISATLDPERRSRLGQFFTPASVARFMASMFTSRAASVHLLDAGAGVGSLSAAFVEEACSRPHPPEKMFIMAYEVDSDLAQHLRRTLADCRGACEDAGIEFAGEVREEDFIRAGADMLGSRLFDPAAPRFDGAILNPPYHKILSDSQARRRLRSIGIETSNLYTAFLAIVVRLLGPGGELVAITPRSFCNGPYFKPFRHAFLRDMNLQRIHVFTSREAAFRDDEVLQENIILHAVKNGKRTKVIVSSSAGPDDAEPTIQEVDYAQIVRPDDPEAFIRILTNGTETRVARRMTAFQAQLEDLGVSVSTGPVVDFRARRWLRDIPEENTVPLIYPCHFESGFIRWPKPGAKKPSAILDAPGTEELLLPAETYVLVKRFSAKEEPRRIVAAIYDPARVAAKRVGLENHLNYFHCKGRGLPANIAKGMAVYLNSSLVDAFFRQFSGHTQVNATDLRNMRYPTAAQLKAMGARVGDVLPGQDEIDAILVKETRA